MRFLLFVLFLLSLFASCSKSTTNVRLEVTHNFAYSGPEPGTVAEGGMVLWGQNSNGDSFSRILNNEFTLNMKLNPGTWTFYVMSWDGMKDYGGADPINYAVFGGEVRCAKSSPTSLEGTSARVELSLKNEHCDDPVFTGTLPVIPSGGKIQLPGFKPTFCSSIQGITTSSDRCNDESSSNAKAPIGSFRMVMRSFDGTGSSRTLLPEKLVGECVTFSPDYLVGSDWETDGLSYTKIPNLPAGGEGLPFHMELEMFPDIECGKTENRGVIVRSLPTGIQHSSADIKYLTSAPDHRPYIAVSPTEICNGRTSTTMTGHPFAGGNGTPSAPYVICSVPQWHAINSDTSNFSKHFKLQADLDFNLYSNGFSFFSLPEVFNCLDIGTNVIPIGHEASCSPLYGFSYAVTSFTGSLRGNNFKLKGIRFRNRDGDTVGLFGRLGVNSNISNLKIEDAEFEGRSYVGALAGEIIGTSSPMDIQIKNIRMKNIDIRAGGYGDYSYTGGLSGSLINASANTIVINNLKLRGEGVYIGGITGEANNAELTYLAVDGRIDNDSHSGDLKIGGVIGNGSTTMINYAKFEGGIFTSGSLIGGIAGRIEGSSSVSNVYTNAFIYSRNPGSNLQVGGLVGQWNASGNLSYGYSLSKVSSVCNLDCRIGGIVGAMITTPSASSFLYRLPAAESGNIGADIVPGENEKTFELLRNTSSFPGFDSSWIKMDGQYPRFAFEEHPCVASSTPGDGMTSQTAKLICNEDDYQNIEFQSGQYFKLGSYIRLPNSSLKNDILSFTKHLDGDGKGLIAGYAELPDSPGVAHIKTLEGSIKNLQLFGLTKKATTSSGSSSEAHGLFVATNNGTIENVKAHVFGTIKSYGAGFVGTNNGIIRNVQLEGIIEAGYSIAPLFYRNSSTGLVEDSSVNTELICTNINCEMMTGLGIVNEGKIQRVEIQGRSREQYSCVTNSFSMLVDQNLSTGVINDVSVSEHAEYRVNGANHYYFHRQNNGTLNRVHNAGKLITDYTGTGSISSFPSDNNAAPGVHNSVFRSGGLSGIRILQEAEFTCTDSFNMNIPNWAYKDPAWDTELATYNEKIFEEKNLVLEFRTDDDTKYIHTAKSFTGTTFELWEPFCTSNGTVSVYYSNDIPLANASGVAKTGVFLPQDNISKLGYDWLGNLWDLRNNPTHISEMLSYYIYKFGYTQTPVTPKTWEYSDDGLQLFRRDE